MEQPNLTVELMGISPTGRVQRYRFLDAQGRDCTKKVVSKTNWHKGSPVSVRLGGKDEAQLSSRLLKPAELVDVFLRQGFFSKLQEEGSLSLPKPAWMMRSDELYAIKGAENSPEKWRALAELWHIPLGQFLGAGARTNTLDNDSFSLERTWKKARPALETALLLPGQECIAALTTLPGDGSPGGMTCLLVEGLTPIGVLERGADGHDSLMLAPEAQGRGLSADFLLMSLRLRAEHCLQNKPFQHSLLDRPVLFEGGSYNDAGLAACKAAHRLAVERAVERGDPVPAVVLKDYPVLQAKARVPSWMDTEYLPRGKSKEAHSEKPDTYI